MHGMTKKPFTETDLVGLKLLGYRISKSGRVAERTHKRRHRSIVYSSGFYLVKLRGATLYTGFAMPVAEAARRASERAAITGEVVDRQVRQQQADAKNNKEEPEFGPES